MELENIKELISYAKAHLELNSRDANYKANRIAEILAGDMSDIDKENAVFGELSLLPSEIDARFYSIMNKSGSKAATSWLYGYCVNNKYVKKDMLDKNPRFTCDNGLIVTINKAKPEYRDPKKAKSGSSGSGGFEKCVICRENEGLSAKRNLRTVSLTLGGSPWFWQYSPYGYFNEHGIAVNCEHTPMHVDKNTFYNLLDFVDLFPHYFIGCNAALERVGGSILAHDHYQGGAEVLPLHLAQIKKYITHEKYPHASAGIVDWASVALRIKSVDRDEIVELSDIIRKAWINYDNEKLGIVSEDENGRHNAISPSVRKTDSGYEMNIILRSNITSEVYPDGVFHAHPEFHAIKKESIGLIESQGLFILPGRLDGELAEIERFIERGEALPKEYAAFKLIYDETKEKFLGGKCDDIHHAMREELGSVCYRILQNTAVFKKDTDLFEFLRSAGFEI